MIADSQSIDADVLRTEKSKYNSNRNLSKQNCTVDLQSNGFIFEQQFVGKKSNYVIRLFETLGRNWVFHVQFEALEEVVPFPAWDDTFLYILS